MVLIGTVPLGGPFLGWLADTVGGRAPLVVGGIVSLLAAAFGWWAGGRTAGQAEPDQDLGAQRLRAAWRSTARSTSRATRSG